jgi:hypothetical protein
VAPGARSGDNAQATSDSYRGYREQVGELFAHLSTMTAPKYLVVLQQSCLALPPDDADSAQDDNSRGISAIGLGALVVLSVSLNST